MATIINSGSASAGRMPFQVLSARRDARQAEETARSLEQQAQSAQRSADREQARADGLSAEASDAGGYSDAARRNLAALESGAQRSSANAGAGRRSGLLVDTYA